MRTSAPLEELLFPPFEGFPKQGINFLKKLKKNNNRPWFQKHKDVYDESVKFSMQCLIASLSEKMGDIVPEVEFNPKRSIFRIYRDVRFSKNKAPYKTNIAAAFNWRGIKGPVESPGFYLHIAPGEVFIGGGVYMPSSDQLKAFRKSMVDRPEEFLSVVMDRRFRKEFKTIQGEKLAKAPLGYPKDHPMIEHLKHKQFFVGKEYGDVSMCLSPKFLGVVVEVFKNTTPLVRWLAKAMR
ncbi:MAG: hypothetical protein HW412_689 [Bacteroidetes bacterium]|nr:hypothetical protein [Bacteroidota bacterium]